MLILGIDPGSRHTGYGLVDSQARSSRQSPTDASPVRRVSPFPSASPIWPLSWRRSSTAGSQRPPFSRLPITVSIAARWSFWPRPAGPCWRCWPPAASRFASTRRRKSRALSPATAGRTRGRSLAWCKSSSPWSARRPAPMPRTPWRWPSALPTAAARMTWWPGTRPARPPGGSLLVRIRSRVLAFPPCL